MKIEKIKALFPVTVEVTQEIINKGKEDIFNTGKCIGARTLASVLPEEMVGDMHLNRFYSWGNLSGHVVTEGSIFEPDCVYAEVFALDDKGSPVEMMHIEKPCTITLTLDRPLIIEW